jgi:outer membrane protein OmpA-like peptidoglycan-associated protein
MRRIRKQSFPQLAPVLVGATLTFLTFGKLVAQTSTAPKNYRSVVGVQTDTVFANSTVVHTRTGISDAQVLREISDEYSLGDEVRITTAPPPTPKPQRAEVPLKENVTVAPANRIAAPPTVMTVEQASNLRPDAIVKSGSIIRAGQLQFEKDAATILPSSYGYLDGIVQFLKERPGITVEVGGHTNTLPSHEYCLTLSDARAKAVASYLSSRGVPSGRLRPRGYGKTQPLVNTQSDEANRQNQRVELKVL